MPRVSGKQLVQHVERHLLRAGRMERVLAAVAGDAQLGQAEDAHAGLAGRLRSRR